MTSRLDRFKQLLWDYYGEAQRASSDYPHSEQRMWGLWRDRADETRGKLLHEYEALLEEIETLRDEV